MAPTCDVFHHEFRFDLQATTQIIDEHKKLQEKLKQVDVYLRLESEIAAARQRISTLDDALIAVEARLRDAECKMVRIQAGEPRVDGRE